MSYYLTFLENQAWAFSQTVPDENFAREILQLFSALISDKQGQAWTEVCDLLYNPPFHFDLQGLTELAGSLMSTLLLEESNLRTGQLSKQESQSAVSLHQLLAILKTLLQNSIGSTMFFFTLRSPNTDPWPLVCQECVRRSLLHGVRLTCCPRD